MVSSQHLDPQLNVRPPAAVMNQAKDALRERDREIRGFIVACLAALAADPDAFLVQLAEYWPPDKPRGRPRRAPTTPSSYRHDERPRPPDRGGERGLRLPPRADSRR